MKNKKKKGYVLIIVMLLCFVMSMTVVSATPLLLRYMNRAKNNLKDLQSSGLYYSTVEVHNYESV
ncbi:MAG: hypothetical protein ACI3XL_05680 [Eubacteriales bacterium]